MQASMGPTSRRRPPSATTYAGKRLLKRTPTYLATHKITHCSTYTTFGFVPTVLLAKRPFEPLEAWLSVEMDEPSIQLKHVAFNAIHKTHCQCGESAK